MNSTRTQQDSRQITIHPQHQSLCMNSIPEKQEGKSLFMNSTSHCSSTVPDTIIRNYYLLSVKKVFTLVKAFYTRIFNNQGRVSKASSSLYKEPSVSIFSKLSFRKTTSQSLFFTTLSLVIRWQP